MLLQDYRYTRPHDPADCETCSARGSGHPLCQKPGCDGLAVAQTRRHATQAEYDALPEQLTPIDGIAHLIVFACDDDAEACVPYCDHPEAPEAACPVCKATGEAPCTSPPDLINQDGSPRTFRHRARADAQSIPQPCMHAHREDCEVFTGCQCANDDPNPVRQPRLVAAPIGDGIDGSRSKLPLTLVKPLVDAHDVPWWTVREVATLQTQDTKAWEIQAVYATLDNDGNLIHDQHGHEVTKTLVIPVDPKAPLPASIAR